MAQVKTVQRKLSEDQKQELLKAMGDVDAQCKGMIQKKDLRTILQLVGQNPTSEEMKEFLPKEEEEGEFDGKSLCEYVENNVHLKSRAELDEEIAGALSKFGDDTDCRMEKEELVTILTVLGREPLSEQEVNGVLSDLQADEHGKLDISELAKLLKKHPVSVSCASG